MLGKQRVISVDCIAYLPKLSSIADENMKKNLDSTLSYVPRLQSQSSSCYYIFAEDDFITFSLLLLPIIISVPTHHSVTAVRPNICSDMFLKLWSL